MGTEPIKLTLPWPPSVNHYWQRNRNGGVSVSQRGKLFRDEVRLGTLKQVRPLRRLLGPVAVTIVANPPDKRRRDLDNLLKATLDSLTHAGAYKDDSQIQSIDIRWGDRVEGGRLDVEIKIHSISNFH
jgi:crossover junction endodeoxyribonuclease RusA